MTRAHELAQPIAVVLTADCRPIVSDQERREARLALNEMARLAADAERLRSCLEVLVEMGDYTYKPHDFATVARAALEASE